MFNPVKASKNIKDEFINYVSTSFSFADADLRKQLLSELNENISNGPWLEINDTFESGLSIEQLIQEGVLSPYFRELESVQKKRLPLERPLYKHQEQAIRAITQGNNTIISTGTGSGKTNCFLIPVINELLNEISNGTLGPGVRALFIYPMNALANDQMKNIRKILMNYPDITFGVYNGSTENDEETAVTVYEAMFASEEEPKLRKRLTNELLSREEMKESPPNILFTNYAMLEHLLFRPNDDVLFSHSDFKFVVLDEAHVYSGATGIETSILLRRLRARITSSKETQFILTSATLGDNDSDILTFANNLCGGDFKKENIIRSTRIKFTPIDDPKHYPNELYIELADDANYAANVLNKYGIPADKNADENELIYSFVQSSDLYQQLRLNITGTATLNKIQNVLGLDSETAISFISLCTRAQKGGRSLIDARYHFFIRSLEGCFLALSPVKKLFLTRQKKYYLQNDLYAVFEAAVCDDCGRIALVGKIQGQYLLQANKLEESIDYFFLQSEENSEIEDEDDDNSKLEHYYLCPHCGAIVPEDEIKNPPCDCGKESYIKVVKAKNLALGARCGNCHRGHYKRFYLGNDAATSVLATALYEELPEIEHVVAADSSIAASNIFSKAVLAKKKVEKKSGRQFLAFSDSRQEAAKFACYLGKSYDEFLRRRGIWQIIKDQENNILNSVFTISDFVIKLTSYFSNKRSFAESNADNSNLTTVSNKNAWIAMLNELSRFNSSTSLTSLGVLQFRYLGNTDEVISALAENYHVSDDVLRNLLDLLIFEIVKAGAICTDNDTDIDDNDREYIFYSALQRFITKVVDPSNKKQTISGWMPRNKEGKKDSFYKTNKLYYVSHFLGIPETEAAEFLEQYFDYLSKPELGNAYCMLDKNTDGTYVMPAKYFQVRIAGDSEAKWYYCPKCGRISQFNENGKCISAQCGEKVKAVDPKTLSSSNHFAQLYLVLSSIFRKFTSERMKKCAGKPARGLPSPA